MLTRDLVVFWCLIIPIRMDSSVDHCNSPRDQTGFLKTCTLDLMPSAEDYPDADWNETRSLRQYNDVLPTYCRNDLCVNSTTFSITKGTFTWEPTTIGFRRLTLCPFAYTEQLYAFRVCILTTNQTLRWLQENTTECPLPLFSRAIEKLYNNITGLASYTEFDCGTILSSLSSSLDLQRSHPDAPVLDEDHQLTMEIFNDWIGRCHRYSISTGVLWDAADLLLDKKFRDIWKYNAGSRFLDYLGWIFPSNDSSEPDRDYFLGNNIYAYSQKVSDGNFNYQFPVDNVDMITATVNVTAPEGWVIHDIRSFLVKSSGIPADYYGPEASDPRFYNVMVGPLFYIKFKVRDLRNLPSKDAKKSQLDAERIVNSMTVEVTLKDPMLEKANIYWCNRIPSDDDRQSESPNSTTMPLQSWKADCETEPINATSILCRCLSPAFVAVFQYKLLSSRVSVDNRTVHAPTEVTYVESDLSVFLGFPYVREIYIAGEVFKAISLVCLVITVLAYAICRKARKGTTTRILLNLCISLIALIVVLYIAAYESKSEIGCRVLNVFRYYLVLVSLLWNAVEAHNMYRMLVKVFNAETSHFVLFAGIFAWGLPMLAVAIGFAVDRKAFDGSYATCMFRCALKPEMRLFGWIVPMSVIILHNLIVFAMVMRVIMVRTNGLRASGQGQGQGQTAGRRLCGALTMLVLLGIPWIMSAFGAIDTHDNSNEDLFQKACSGILVVFVLLQGLFIFFFHCVRNRTIRDLVKMRLNTSVLTFKSSLSSSRTSSLNLSSSNTTSTHDVIVQRHTSST